VPNCKIHSCVNLLSVAKLMGAKETLAASHPSHDYGRVSVELDMVADGCDKWN
jgi:hypothetical protein